MGAIDSTANRIVHPQNSSPTSTVTPSSTGSTGTPGGQADVIEQGYEEFAQEQNGNTKFDQATWNTYKQQLGNKVGQNGGSLNAGSVEAAEAVEATKSGGTSAGQHMLPPGTQLKFEDGSEYTVKPGDTISYESLQQYMPKTQTRTAAGTPDHDKGFKPVTDSTNPLSPSNNDVKPNAQGKKPAHRDYYADLNSPTNPANPNGLYGINSSLRQKGDTGHSGSAGSTAVQSMEGKK